MKKQRRLANDGAGKGFFILPSQLFQRVAASPEKNVNLNETLAQVFRSIEASAAGTDSEEQVKGLSLISSSTAPVSATL